MKKYLSIYTLLALACIVLQSCLFSEEEIFDESSANRATADVIKCQEILKDVPNGWKLEYYIGSNYSAGAVTLLMKFDGKQVEMASETGAESYKPGTIITSLYQVKSELNGPMKRTTGLKRLAFVSAGFKVSSPPVLNSEL